MNLLTIVKTMFGSVGVWCVRCSCRWNTHRATRVRLRSGVGVHRGQEAQGPLLRDVAASQRRHLHKGISRGDHGGVLPTHVSAFGFLGGVPQSILSTSRRLPSPRYWEEDVASARVRSRTFSRTTCSAVLVGRVGKGNDKGSVEGMVGYGIEELPGADPAELRCAQRITWRVSAWSVWTKAQGPHREHRRAYGA